MRKYAEAAKIAAITMGSSKEPNPVLAWEAAVVRIFPNSESARKKGCPRAAFLGLCEEGVVIGCKPGNYTQSVKNKRYVVKALNFLREKPELQYKPLHLWKLVLNKEDKVHNHQMDVVISLFKNKLLNP